MSTLLNPGKNVIQYNKESQLLHNSVIGLPAQERNLFESNLQVIYRPYPDGTRDIITIDTNYDISGPAYISQNQFYVNTCECLSNINNSLNLMEGLGGNLIYWYWQNVNVQMTSESEGEGNYYDNICNWDGLTEAHYPLTIFDSSGEEVVSCYGPEDAYINPGATLHQGQIYNIISNEPVIVEIPEIFAIEESEEVYGPCQGYPEYCSQYFEDYGVCPDSENMTLDGPMGGCIFNQSMFNTGGQNTGSGINNYVMEEGATYEVYMNSDMPPFFFFHGFDDSSTLSVEGYYYELVGGMNRRGSRCNCCGCSYSGSNSSGSPAEGCCARMYGGVAAEYIVEPNSACDRDSYIYPDMNGYNCYRISSPPGYNLCGADINLYTGGFNPVYCAGDESCLVLPNTEEQGQCVEGWDGFIYPFDETPATPGNTSCPDGTVPIRDDELQSFAGAQDWVDDYNSSWGDFTAGWVPGCCYQIPEAAEMRYVCQSEDAVANFESNYNNTGVAWISDYSTFIRPLDINGNDNNFNNIPWSNLSSEDIYTLSTNAEAGEQLDPRKICVWMYDYIKNTDDQWNNWPSYLADSIPDYSNIAALEDGQVGLNQPNLTRFECFYAEISHGCKIPSACNYNPSADVHNDAMCSFESDCMGNCRKNLDGSYNNFAIWGLDACGLCSTTHPWYQDSPVTAEYYAAECGECRVDEKVNIASSYVSEIGSSDNSEETVWWHDYNSAPYSVNTGDAICYATSQKSCAAIEVELPGGEWYLINEIPNDYSDESTGISWTSHNIDNYLNILPSLNFESNGCELDWPQLVEVAEQGNLFSGLQFIPFKQIRAACGIPPKFNTTFPGENWTFGVTNTKFSGTISDLLVKRSELIGDPVANDDDETNYFASEKPVFGNYESRFWGLIPFMAIGIEGDDPQAQPYDIAITEVVDASDVDTRVYATVNGQVSNPNFTFEIGKQYHFRIHINPTGIDATPGIFGDAFKFTALSNNTTYWKINSNNPTLRNFTLGSLNKIVCCQDQNGNDICDTPLIGGTYCVNPDDAALGVPALYDAITHCGALEINSIVHHNTYGDINGCMDPAAINYNPQATNNVPEGICNYSVPFEFAYETSTLGTQTNVNVPAPTSENHLEVVKYKKQTQEDVETINTFITIWDYNFGTHQQVWTINDIELKIETQNLVTNDVTGNIEQGILKNFSINNSLGENGLEHFGSIGSRTYNGVGYSDVQKYRIHLNYTPSNDVTGDFDNLSRIEVKHPYNNIYSEMYWHLVLTSKNDYPKIKTYGPNLLKTSQVDTSLGWTMWQGENSHDTTTADKVIANALDGPGFSTGDDYKTEVWFKNPTLNNGGVLQDTPNQNIVTHAMVHNLGSILRFPHRKNGSGGGDITSNVQIFTNTPVAEGNYVLSCWVKYLDGNLPEEATEELVKLRVRRHQWPWTSYFNKPLLPILRSSRDNGNSWKRVEMLISWEDIGYKPLEVASSYDTLNEFEYAGLPKYCMEGVGPECTHPTLPLEELIQYKNIVIYKGGKWYKTLDTVQEFRVGFESAGNTFEDGTNIQIGVYGVQLERDEDFVNYYDTTSTNGIIFQEGRRFTDKITDRYYLPAEPMAADTENPSIINWDYNGLWDECDARVSYKFTTIKDKRYLSEELSEASQQYIFRELEDWTGWGENVAIGYYGWDYSELDMFNEFDDDEYVLRDNHTILVQMGEFHTYECNPWVGGFNAPPEDEDDDGGGSGGSGGGQLGPIAQEMSEDNNTDVGPGGGA